MKKVSIALLIFMLCIFSYSKFSIVSAEQPKTIDELFSLSTLYDNNNGYQSYHASSYDLEEGNLDGVYFNKLENIQYTTTLLEVEGPGAITRFWTAGYSHHEEIKTIKIYVDGKLLIDCKALDFFNGLYKPFIKPYVGLGNETGGGVYCYVPIVFQKSIRITGQFVNYYNIDYTLFPKDYVVTSTTITDEPVVPSWYKDNTHALDAICDGEITTEDYQLIAGKTTTIYEDNTPGVLQGFNINIENLIKSTEKCSQISESGRYIKAGGEISFDMNLNPNNKGAYLKYRIDTIWSNLIVDVYVDNTYVGRSEAGPSNSEYRFKDLYIQIPKNLTENKSEVRVKFEVVSIDGLDAPFNNFWMYSVLDEGTILTDFLDLLNGKNESLNNFVIRHAGDNQYNTFAVTQMVVNGTEYSGEALNRFAVNEADCQIQQYGKNLQNDDSNTKQVDANDEKAKVKCEENHKTSVCFKLEEDQPAQDGTTSRHSHGPRNWSDRITAYNEADDYFKTLEITED